MGSICSPLIYYTNDVKFVKTPMSIHFIPEGLINIREFEYDCDMFGVFKYMSKLRHQFGVVKTRYDNIKYTLNFIEDNRLLLFHIDDYHGANLLEIHIKVENGSYSIYMSNSTRDNWTAVILVALDIGKRLKLLQSLCLGLTDKDSTLFKLSRSKIFDKHLVGLIYSFVN